MKTIRIPQFMRPFGAKRLLYADIPDELEETANGLEISAEMITPDKVMIYAHRKGESKEDELTELADNGPGRNSPQEALARLIRRFHGRR